MQNCVGVDTFALDTLANSQGKPTQDVLVIANPFVGGRHHRVRLSVDLHEIVCPNQLRWIVVAQREKSDEVSASTHYNAYQDAEFDEHDHSV